MKAGKTKAITERFREFVDDQKLPVEHLILPDSTVNAQVRVMTTTIAKLESMLRGLDAEAYYAEDDLWSRLETLLELIKVKLAEVERRLQ